MAEIARQGASFPKAKRSHSPPMQIHGSCAGRDGTGVLLIGPPGSGKSDLLLRLLSRGFDLVADDRVEIESGMAIPPAALAGLLEVRGLGIFRLPFRAPVRLALVADLTVLPPRLPEPARHAALGLPMVGIDAAAASAPERVALALDCALGRVAQLAGAFAA
ncbi:MAG: phosphotransferase [Proteobacteria bacterium]|nr:phosphotransferase [Pseudomonadota bacterium]